jgi:hypothetical protein
MKRDGWKDALVEIVWPSKKTTQIPRELAFPYHVAQEYVMRLYPHARFDVPIMMPKWIVVGFYLTPEASSVEGEIVIRERI